MENEKSLEYYEQQIKEAANRVMKNWGLKWTFKSLDYILNVERVSLIQCAQAYFTIGNLNDWAADMDVSRAVKILLMAGVVGGSGLMNVQELESKAYAMMEEWREVLGDINSLHLILVERLREDHFFSEDLPVGIGLIKKMLRIPKE